MFALSRGEDRSQAQGLATVRRILPRWLRRPVRVLARLLGGDFEPPRYAATIASVSLLAATGVYGAAVGGHMPVIVQTVAVQTGFAVSDIRVGGNRETSEIDVIGALGLDGFTSLVGFDANLARERVAELPWVEHATIRKVYPNTVEIDLTERTAFAIWQNDGQLLLVEKDGRVIAPLSSLRHSALPLFVGAGAPEHAAAFLAEIERYPDLRRQVAGYVRVADRRWDVRLRQGISLKLPENHEREALASMARLEQENSLLSRDIVAIDLRLRDRVTVQLAPDAAETRRERMQELVSGRRARRT